MKKITKNRNKVKKRQINQSKLIKRNCKPQILQTELCQANPNNLMTKIISQNIQRLRFTTSMLCNVL